MRLDTDAFWQSTAMLYSMLSRLASAAASGDKKALQALADECAHAASYSFRECGVEPPESAA